MENSAEQGKPDWEKIAKEIPKVERPFGHCSCSHHFDMFTLPKALQEVYERGKDEQAEIDAKKVEEMQDSYYEVPFGKVLVAENLRAARKREK